jgi:predicted methyltransferase
MRQMTARRIDGPGVLPFLAAALALLTANGCAGKPDAPAPQADAARSATGTAIRIPEPIALAVASAERPEADRKRDADRRPAEVLAFFGIEPGMRVADLMAGTGYYTEILARAVGPEGKVYAQNNRFVLERFAEQPLTERLARPGLENVVRLDRELESPGLPDGLDAAIMIRFYHDMYWMETNRKAFDQAVFAALKPGAVFGVVDHQAPAGSGFQHARDLHRVEADLVMKELLATGFEFDAASDVLANPDDTHDWNIFADDSARRDKTDRFVFRFRKPR